jgi:hypothetical protein
VRSSGLGRTGDRLEVSIVENEPVSVSRSGLVITKDSPPLFSTM